MKTLLTVFSFSLLIGSFPAFAEDKSNDDGIRLDPVVKEIEGWMVYVEPALLEGGEAADLGKRALRMLGDHLNRIQIMVPKDRLKDLMKVGIWIEKQHPNLDRMQYHPSQDWLKEHGHDVRLTKKVHITQAAALLSKHQMLKHPWVILHELAHGYHDQILSFDHPKILEAYAEAKESGTYEKVLQFTGENVRHYGITNHKEYFAEGTEAWFGRNDFYPFVRAEIKKHDPVLNAVLEEIWGK